MKLKVLGTILLLCGVAIGWRTVWQGDDQTDTAQKVLRTSSIGGPGTDSQPSSQRHAQRNRPDDTNLTDALDAMGFTISANRISNSSAEGSVMLHGPDKLEITTKELQTSHSTGDLILMGPTIFRTPKTTMKIEGEDAVLRINPNGSFSANGSMTMETKAPEE
jgi:hypothetical protein